jgi:hypothetical protein
MFIVLPPLVPALAALLASIVGIVVAVAAAIVSAAIAAPRLPIAIAPIRTAMPAAVPASLLAITPATAMAAIPAPRLGSCRRRRYESKRGRGQDQRTFHDRLQVVTERHVATDKEPRLNLARTALTAIIHAIRKSSAAVNLTKSRLRPEKVQVQLE